MGRKSRLKFFSFARSDTPKRDATRATQNEVCARSFSHKWSSGERRHEIRGEAAE